ncbi:hypothetical protein AOLI_G00321190 [Acnodon oligacanthus]
MKERASLPAIHQSGGEHRVQPLAGLRDTPSQPGLREDSGSLDSTHTYSLRDVRSVAIEKQSKGPKTEIEKMRFCVFCCRSDTQGRIKSDCLK